MNNLDRYLTDIPENDGNQQLEDACKQVDDAIMKTFAADEINHKLFKQVLISWRSGGSELGHNMAMYLNHVEFEAANFYINKGEI